MQLFLKDGRYIILNEGIDCSIPLSASEQNPRAWYVDQPVIEPVRGNGWVGAVAEGGSVNFRNVFFNPHGHGTHTASSEWYSKLLRLRIQFIRSILYSFFRFIFLK